MFHHDDDYVSKAKIVRARVKARNSKVHRTMEHYDFVIRIHSSEWECFVRHHMHRWPRIIVIEIVFCRKIEKDEWNKYFSAEVNAIRLLGHAKFVVVLTFIRIAFHVDAAQ